MAEQTRQEREAKFHDRSFTEHHSSVVWDSESSAAFYEDYLRAHCPTTTFSSTAAG